MYRLIRIFPSIIRSNPSKFINNNYYKAISSIYKQLEICRLCQLELTPVRYKYTKGKQTSKKIEEDLDKDDTDDDLNDIPLDKSSKLITTTVNSLRIDLILKSGLNIARNKVEVAFYESRIRLNGKKIFKKSEKCHIGDEIDIVKGLSPNNVDFLIVSRVEILSAKEDEDSIIIKLRRTKSLLIENYEEPWKPIKEE